MTTSGQFMNKLAYSAMFRDDVDDVVRHLSSVIVSPNNGYDEGIDFYVKRLEKLLADDREFREARSRMSVQTTFTDREWRDILGKLVEKLRRHVKHDSRTD